MPLLVARAPDFAAWRRATLVHLLGARDLGFVSGASPTFLTVLLQALDDPGERAAVLAALGPARADEVARVLAAGPDRRALWPRLGLVSCWADGPAAQHLAPLVRAFPGVPIQAKGLLATEGVVSIPWVTGRAGRWR